MEIVRSDYIDVGTGMPVLQFGNNEFVRGVSGEVWFRLENVGDEEIEIITATRNGNADSSTIRYQLVDNDGNVLVTAPFKQIGTENLVTLANGNVVARIAPGAAFVSQPTAIMIPSGAPDELQVRLIVDKVSYHQGREDEVVMQGLTGEFTVRLADTSYYGEVASIKPATSFGEEDIVIAGRAIDRESGVSLGFVPLKLVIGKDGFERTKKDEGSSRPLAFVPFFIRASDKPRAGLPKPMTLTRAKCNVA